ARRGATAGSALPGGMRRRRGQRRRAPRTAARGQVARQPGTKPSGLRELKVLRRRRGEDAEQARPEEAGPAEEAGPEEAVLAEEAGENGAGEAAVGGPGDVNDGVPPDRK